jgi:hypothetical protein
LQFISLALCFLFLLQFVLVLASNCLATSACFANLLFFSEASPAFGLVSANFY